MLFPSTTIGDLQVRVLLIPPHYSGDRVPQVTHRWDTTIGEGRTTIEERRPGRGGLLLAQSIVLHLAGNLTDDWNKGLAALGERPVAVPLWVDRLPPARWSERIYDAQKIIGWDAVTGAFTIYDGPDLPGVVSYALYAPLMIGRWEKRPAAVGLTNKTGTVEFTLTEARPWSCRIGIHAYGSAWTAKPDWTSPVKTTSTYALELLTLPGVAASEPGLDARNAAARWMQEGSFTFADRLAIRRALSWFEAMRGAWQSWSPVPAWFQPGADTPATPANYTARFGADALTLKYVSGNTARAQIGFIQEIDTGARSQALAGEAHLYALTYQYDTGHPELYTSWDAPLTTAVGTFQPKQCAHKELVLSLRPQDMKAELSLVHATGSLAADWIVARLFGWVRLKIWSCDPADAAASAKPLFEGYVKTVLPDGNMLALTATLLSDFLDRQMPTDEDGPACCTYVFSARCGLAEATYRSTGTIAPADVSSDGMTITVHGATGFGGTAYADGWFAPNGILRTGADRNRQVASIVQSVMSGADLIVKLSRPLWADKIAGGGQAVDLVPSCTGRYEADCATKYSNQPNFRGFPFKPEYLEQRSIASTKAPGK
jgi:hypothetical protein